MLYEVEENTPVADQGKREAYGTAIVTGGRRGIGRAICLALVKRGFDIAMVDIVDDEEVERTLTAIREHERRVSFHQCDISRTDQHQNLLDDIESVHDKLGCLVNNAGIQVSDRGDLLNLDEGTFDSLIGINLKGTFFFSIATARRMIGAASSVRERSIITITSANAGLVSPEKGPYCISKAGLSMASQQLAVRLADEGIRVHEIRPGLIETDMTKVVHKTYSQAISNGSICPMRRWGEPEDIARCVATLACGDMPFSTGDIYNIGGGMQIPRL